MKKLFMIITIICFIMAGILAVIAGLHNVLVVDVVASLLWLGWVSIIGLLITIFVSKAKGL